MLKQSDARARDSGLELRFAADWCPCVEKLRTVSPLTWGGVGGVGGCGQRRAGCWLRTSRRRRRPRRASAAPPPSPPPSPPPRATTRMRGPSTRGSPPGAPWSHTHTHRADGKQVCCRFRPVLAELSQRKSFFPICTPIISDTGTGRAPAGTTKSFPTALRGLDTHTPAPAWLPFARRMAGLAGASTRPAGCAISGCHHLPWKPPTPIPKRTSCREGSSYLHVGFPSTFSDSS
jgi:hypothetical protein